MKSRISHIFLLLLSVLYAAVVLTTFTADRLASLATYKVEEVGEYDSAIGLIEKAVALDPMNADLYFRKYEIISDLLKRPDNVILSEADLSAEARAKEEGRVEESKLSSPLPLASSLTPSLRLSAEALAKAEAKGDEAILKYNLQKQQLHLVKQCIELRPFWPKYHLTYGLLLAKKSPSPNIITRQLILFELKKASELKPYSDLYRNIYQKYITRYE